MIVGVAKDEVRFKVNDPEVQRQARMKRLQRIMAAMDMGYLMIDKDFLEKIVSQPETVAAPNKRSIAELLALASTCYHNATYLQDLLRIRRPFYVILFQRHKIPKGRRMMIERERKLRRNVVIVKADFLLRLLQAARINKDYPTFFKLVAVSGLAQSESPIYYKYIYCIIRYFEYCSFLEIGISEKHSDVIAALPELYAAVQFRSELCETYLKIH